MTNPRDPRFPGPNGAYDQTQIGAPVPGAMPPSGPVGPPRSQPFPQQQVPQAPVAQPPVAQHQYGQNPYGQPQAGQAPYGRPQYGQAQYGQAPYGQPQYGQAQPNPYAPGPTGWSPVAGPGIPAGPPGQYPYGYPMPQPKKSNTGLIVGALTLVVLVAAAVSLAIVQPWKSDGPRGPVTETYALDHSVTVEVKVPEGWTGQVGSVEGDRTLFLLPESDTRTPEQIDREMTRISDGGTASPIHMVIAQVVTCPRSATGVQSGTWRVDELESRDLSGHKMQRLPAVFKVDGSSCLNLIGFDSQSGTSAADSEGTAMGRKLADVDHVTASKAT